MAYGLKYFYDFADITPVLYRVNLYALDYTGDAAELQAGVSPFTHDYAQTDKYTAITGCIFELQAIEQPAQFVGQPDFFIEDIYPQRERSIYFELRLDPENDNTLLHKGWLVGPRTGVSVKGGDQLISFTASCGLSQLKNEDFTGLSDRQSFFNTIKFILLKTGLNLPFRIATKWTWFDGTTTGSVFQSMYHIDAFGIEGERPSNCADVLKQILEITNCEIFQESGCWTIRSVELSGEDTIEYNYYNPDGTVLNLGVEINQLLTIDKVNLSFSRDTQQQIESSIRTFAATVKSGRFANLLINGHLLNLEMLSPTIGIYEGWDNDLFSSTSQVGKLKIKNPVREPTKPNPNTPPDTFFAAVAAYEDYYFQLLNDAFVSNWSAINQQQLNNGLTFELKGKFKANGGDFATNPVHLPITIRLKTDLNDVFYYTPDKKLTKNTLYRDVVVDGGLFHFIPYSPTDLDDQDRKQFTISIDQSLRFPKIFNYFTHISIGIHQPVFRYAAITGNEYIELYWVELRLKGQEFTETHEVKNEFAASETEVNLLFNFGLAETSILSNISLILNPSQTKTVTFIDSSDETGGNPIELCLEKRASQYNKPIIQFEGQAVTKLKSLVFSKYSDVIYIPWLTGPTNQRFKQIRRQHDFRTKRFDFTGLEKL